MKKIIFIVAIIVFSMSLICCTSFKENMIKERVSQLNLKDDRAVADECFERIMECIKNTDKEGLKEMFASNALKEAENIDVGIDYVMDFYKGKIQSKDAALQVSDHNDHGEKTSEIKAFYTVETNEGTYIVFFIDNTVDIKNANNVGLYMLQIIKECDEDNEFDWGGKKTRCAGIYMPDSEKQQITE
ncbi:DUF5104 domain-containing protein [Clostridium botulinum]|nr:DUF5104 domain-containing protein [Clostridium botulinum]